MSRIIYDVETAHYGGRNKKKKNRNKSNNWTHEKREVALRCISNASVLSDAANTFKCVLEKNPDSSLKEALDKVDKVIEDMKREFKNNYVL